MPKKDTRTTEEKLQALEDERAKVEKRLAQIDTRKNDILFAEFKRENTPARKARNHRLIEIGASIESYFGYDLDTPELRKALIDFLADQDKRGGFATKWMQAAKESSKP